MFKFLFYVTGFFLGIIVSVIGALNLYQIVRFDPHANVVRLEVQTDGTVITADRIYWESITQRTSTLSQGFISRGSLHTHATRAYVRSLWLDADVAEDITTITVCNGDTCKSVPQEVLSRADIELVVLDDDPVQGIHAVRLPLEDIRTGSALSFLDDVLNWGGDTSLVFLVVYRTIQGTVQLLGLIAAVYVIAWILRRRTTHLDDLENRFTGTLLTSRRTVVLVLLCIIATGLVLRFLALGNLDPHIDEYAHINAARQVAGGRLPDYRRGLIVSLAMGAVYRIVSPQSFGAMALWGVVPGIITNTLVIVPLYALARRVSTLTGLVAAALWAVSPWAILMAHNMREYAYFPLFVMLFLWSVIRILEQLFLDERINPQDILLSSVTFVVFSIYTFRVDTASTMRIGFLLAGLSAIGFFLWHRASVLSRLKRFPLLSVFGAVPLAVLGYIVWRYATGGSHLSIVPQQPSWRWLDYLFSHESPLNWWSRFAYLSRPGYVPLVMALFLFPRERSRYGRVWFLTLLGGMAFYLLFFDRYFSTRYIYYLLPFVTLVFAGAIRGVYLGVRSHDPGPRRVMLSILSILLLLNMVSPLQTARAVTSRKNHYSDAGIYQPRVQGVLCFLPGRLEPEMAIIQTHLGLPLLVDGIAAGSQIHGYSFRDPERIDKITDTVKDHPAGGYILLDVRRGHYWASGLPIDRDFELDGVPVETLGRLDEFLVYRWGDHGESRFEATRAMQECSDLNNLGFH